MPRIDRALFEVGNTLRKLGRYREALEAYEKLGQLNPKVPRMGHFVLNWKAHLPELWLRELGPKQCLARMSRCARAGAAHHTPALPALSGMLPWPHGALPMPQQCAQCVSLPAGTRTAGSVSP